MRVLILDPCYAAFLRSFYLQHPDLAQSPYDAQWRALMDQCFGAADFYSSNLTSLGHEATEIVINCEPLQRQWAKEHATSLDKAGWTFVKRGGLVPWPRRTPPEDWSYAVLKAQVKHYRPDVLYVQDMNNISSLFLREIRPYVRLIVGQIACPIVPGADFSEYDLVISSFPHYVEQFRSDGLLSEYLKWAFEPRVLARLKEDVSYPVVFVGGLSPDHEERIRLLETVSASQTVDLWGYGIDCLDQQSPLRAAYHGEAWAVEMYQLLYNADIALNNHISVAGNYANNMRLYEATGVGTFVLTDYKDNLHTLFDPGKEVVAYRSAEECAELITYYLAHEEERETIARAGQARTLREHTYGHRMQELVEILNRYL